MSTFLKDLVTCGPIGYVPMPGTCATLIAVPIALLFNYVSAHPLVQLVFLLSAIVWAWYCIERSSSFFTQPDSQHIVIDEVIGCIITFSFLPINILTIITGIVLFRFFDISKIGCVGWAERVPGAAGILLDDIVAGLCANLCVRCILWIM